MPPRARARAWGASDYSGGSGGGGGGGEVVSPTSPLFPIAGTVGATHAGGMGAGGAVFGQQRLQGQGQGHSGVGMGMGMGMGYQGVGGGGMGVGVGGAMGAMGGMGGMGTAAEAAYLKEYSIFVGDLAPETSNSDLVAVFRNPVLGLRNDRASKFIRPFASCKSAKIMLDPVTGVSRGYGFVRFTDEADQQRALIEMHGLYCLSRPTAAERVRPIAVPSTASYYPGGGDAVAYAPGGGVMSTSATGGGTGAEYFAQQYGVGVPQQQVQAPVQQQQPVHPPQQGNDEWRHASQARTSLGNLIGPNGEQLTGTDPYNTTVFVGGLSPLVGEETLRTFFVPFGELHYVKVPVGKRCGFVQFVRKADAERAIEKMQGFPVGGSQIRLSWGRSQCCCSGAQAAAMAQAQPPAVVQAPVVVLRQQAGASSGNGNNHSHGGNAITPAMLEGMTHEQAVMLLQSGGVNGGGGGNANARGGSYSVGAPNGSGGNANGAEAYRNGFHSSSPSNGNVSVSEAYGGGGGKACFTDESLKVRWGEEVESLGYPQRGACEVPASASVGSGGGGGGSSSHSATTSSFSPFSPDPNQHQPYGHGPGHPHQQSQHQGQGPIGGLYVAVEMLGKRRDSYAGYGHGQLLLPHPSKAYAPGFFPVAPALQMLVGGGNGKPIGMGSCVGSGSGSLTRGGYGDGGGFSESPPAFQINRYTSHAQTQPILRPNSGSARSIGGGGGVASEFDAMHDLNGTLASLDLDCKREREREFAIGERAWSLKSRPTVQRAWRARAAGGACSFGCRREARSPAFALGFCFVRA
ncbi:hypothetical protein B0H14DRAFT_3173676 [Mycena olivaceomarginata]|nr:hypothetical protein B0H14DRAFT_3173676 [Mycena olivaceomarginata]